MGTLIDRPEQGRYEFLQEGALVAYEEYELDDRSISLKHTETLPQYQGQGLAQEFVLQMLSDLQDRDIEVLPQCSFVAKIIRNHEEYLHLVPEDNRSEFGL